ncbi:hypothetical protein CU098_007247 [Rhizopus stolonifer]|uniref:Uncharacterized protein n=1 Tax=Rhizopus stolonifer TaxID=4846 RepID=A0A367KVZ4_RHIST|nr:hypothetical protein CU098_007247 [Rhizopus stolonifer]
MNTLENAGSKLVGYIQNKGFRTAYRCNEAGHLDETYLIDARYDTNNLKIPSVCVYDVSDVGLKSFVKKIIYSPAYKDYVKNFRKIRSILENKNLFVTESGHSTLKKGMISLQLLDRVLDRINEYLEAFEREYNEFELCERSTVDLFTKKNESGLKRLAFRGDSNNSDYDKESEEETIDTITIKVKKRKAINESEKYYSQDELFIARKRQRTISKNILEFNLRQNIELFELKEAFNPKGDRFLALDTDLSLLIAHRFLLMHTTYSYVSISI